VLGVRGDATGGTGDFPIGEVSFFVFTKRVKNDLCVNFELSLFKDDPLDRMKFSHSADHPLTAEFEDQMTAFLRDYTGDSIWRSTISDGGE
jgi:hypothetical protein